ncbi:MAG: Xaa-Pro peptidase family protein [Candidatus Edwardsbacteria bacterium]|nr:Xaa-Pro peptidase family protein [Candidatus Edwardsbacteria bacterium]MBU1577571.1 Xaa-Pro peptidase family protein [Candidatus Edwardsbacteria bacterium]MBU2462601.1 Xaa-Pro peptidase family protein [Candidatus Edwardsbacteria bacterium]MBU2593666.1 Xaa-Pro peptidase family protein [Candidatus Edwardsbacteria bacterium]
MVNNRIDNIKKALRLKKLDAMLFTNLLNIRYLAGYSGSSGMLLVNPRGADFLTDFRYKEQSAKEVKNARTTIIVNSLLEELSRLPAFVKAKKIGIEEQNLSYAQFLQLQKLGPKKKFIPVSGMAENLRQVKTSDEIQKIARAAQIADLAFAKIIKFIKPGLTEKTIAAQLDHTLKMLGSTNPSFDSIVGSGPNGALPHAQPGERKVRKGDFIVLDFGAIFQGYHSDMTRTVCLGKPSEKHLKIYDIVTKAQAAGLKAVKAGVKGREADLAARKIINDAGYGKYYGHGLGHGVGLAVHEAPGVGMKSENPLPENSIVTVEPGIYLPGWGGVRIEDLVVVAKGGCRILSRSTKKLITIKA